MCLWVHGWCRCDGSGRDYLTPVKYAAVQNFKNPCLAVLGAAITLPYGILSFCCFNLNNWSDSDECERLRWACCGLKYDRRPEGSWEKAKCCHACCCAPWTLCCQWCPDWCACKYPFYLRPIPEACPGSCSCASCKLDDAEGLVCIQPMRVQTALGPEFACRRSLSGWAQATRVSYHQRPFPIKFPPLTMHRYHILLLCGQQVLTTSQERHSQILSTTPRSHSLASNDSLDRS